ncbi:hypothetical protein PP744_gp013 [Rhizobium phage RHph_N38]|uniref:Uncharacterized protein n=1 Tax=Rhizobium phage RHph_N38 TaxID=2509750 RepID=A0A7S5UVL4_9CAUD|nr:hypothetical protein PP744_gp013 [Rhizobium phage RHph_N38]QIG70476.1 hypothetical protein EVB89_013 [Rhizobium phage RHph_N38]
MKLTIEIEIPDEKIQHPRIAEQAAKDVLKRLEGLEFRYSMDSPPEIYVEWEFKKYSGTKTNERNPS